MRKSNNDGQFVLGAVFGAAVAGIAALLFAPKSGAELRQDISDEFDEFLIKAEGYKDYAMDRGADLMDQAAEMRDNVELQIRETAYDVRHSFDQAMDKAEDKWEDVKSDAKDVAEEAKKEAKAAGQELESEAKETKDKVEAGAKQAEKEAKHLADETKDAAKDLKDSAKESADKVQKAAKDAK